MVHNMSTPPFRLDRTTKVLVEEAIREVCDFRGYYLHALNARPTHAHIVVAGQTRPEPIANAFKSYSTRKLRERGLIENSTKVWARGRSRRYLWKENHLSGAIDYVLYCQGDTGFEEWYENFHG